MTVSTARTGLPVTRRRGAGRSGLFELRRRTVHVAFATSLVTLAVNAGYFLGTADRPNRPALWVLQAIAVVIGVLVIVLPWSRWRDGRWAPAVLHAWVGSQTLLIGVAASFDGGTSSPLIVLLFLPLAIAALAFRPGPVALHGATSAAVYLAVGAADGTFRWDLGLLWVSTLLVTAAISSSVSQRLRGLALQLDLANDELHSLARSDSLTGLLNHRSFHEELGIALSRQERDGAELALLLLDLDHFKRINDVLGHPAGDEVLVQVAGAIRDAVRLGDLVGRTGGEEFGVILPNTDLDGAVVVGERVREAIASAGGPPRVTSSAGLSLAPAHATDREALVRVADDALYVAKRTGRDRLVVADAEVVAPKH